jgi:two-component system sensor histidine kinase DesK
MSSLSGKLGWRTGERPSSRQRALWTSVPLVYLVPLGKEIAGYQGAKALLAESILAVFVAMYVALVALHRSWTSPSARRDQALLGAFAVLIIGAPFVLGLEWVGLATYLAVACAVVLPIPKAAWGVVIAAVVTCAQGILLGRRSESIVTSTLTCLSIGIMMVAFRQARTLVVELQEARGEVARLAANEERLRIARDLHDLLGHSLSLIVLKSELAGRVADRDPAATAREVRDIESVARQALADVREAVSGYRRRVLSEELDNARSALAAAAVDAVVRTSGSPLPDPVDGLFGWAVREGVTNVVRHAGAGRCTIEVSRDAGHASLEIRDDGTGGVGTQVLGSGLSGLTERVTAAGGHVTAGPAPDGGFRLVVTAPLEPWVRRPAVESQA